MTALRVAFGTAAGTVVLTLWACSWDPAVPTGNPQVRYDWRTPTISAPAMADEPRFEFDRGERLVDRYGNQLERAVTDYRIDRRGDLYERHSPQTALPKLGPPVG